MSSDAIVITLDCGGSAAKAHAFDANGKGHLVSTLCSYPDGGDDPGIFDAGAWWESAVLALRDLVNAVCRPAGSFLGITVSAIRIPQVLLDRRRALAGPSVLNTDRRGEEALAELTRDIGVEQLYALTGHWPSGNLGLAKLLWLRAKWPEVWRRTATVLQLHDWFVYQLSGVVVSELSSAAMSQLVDVEAGCWATTVLEATGIRPSLLPELVTAGTLVGRVSKEAASSTGLPHALPVYAGGGDTHLSAISASARTLQPVVVAGTTAPAQVMMDTLPTAAERYPLFASPHVLADRFALETNAGTTAGVLGRLAGVDEFRGSGLTAALTRRGFLLDKRYSGPLLVLSANPFFGPNDWSLWPSPTILGLSRTHSGSDVRQAGLVGTCLAIRSILEPLDVRCGTSCVPVVATGGMSRNSEWCQLLADVCAREVIVPPLEAIAGLAGAALAVPCDPAELHRAIPVHRYIPTVGHNYDRIYLAYREQYRRAQRDLRDCRDISSGTAKSAPRARRSGRRAGNGAGARARAQERASAQNRARPRR